MRILPTLFFLSCSTAIKIVEDIDGDGFPSDIDCNDKDANIHPRAEETCNGVDDNCDGLVDAEDPEVVDLNEGYWDADGDGWGIEPLIQTCDAVVLSAGDCDDSDASINPFANEYCNDLDDNCDDVIDNSPIDSAQYFIDQDGDGYGSALSTVWACEAPEGYAAQGGDCNEETSTIFPGAQEVCDGLDNDCDGLTDDADEDLDLSNGILYYADSDGDGYGDPDVAYLGCAPPEGYVDDNTDCNDLEIYVNPGVSYDRCNGIDDNCNGQLDEDVKSGWSLVSIASNVLELSTVDASYSILSNAQVSGVNSMDVSENGVSIVHQGGNSIWTMDICSGTGSRIGYHGVGNMGGIAFAPTGVLYGIDIENNNLIQLDIQTGQGSVVGPLGFDLSYCGLAYDCANQRMVGADADTAQLFTIDLQTGEAYDFVQTSVPYQGVGLEYEPSTGMFLTSTNTEIYRVDPNTGSTTLVGGGLSGINDLAFAPNCAQ
ncbi:MAG: putative metal-binding motif-containing protein [Myxococcota bacterium]|nr:putative metal-binding motif-containing protein [Myxococcota bacterium]